MRKKKVKEKIKDLASKLKEKYRCLPYKYCIVLAKYLYWRRKKGKKKKK